MNHYTIEIMPYIDNNVSICYHTAKKFLQAANNIDWLDKLDKGSQNALKKYIFIKNIKQNTQKSLHTV